MMLYVLSCGLCEFSAEATDIRGFGLQLIKHGSRCDGDPVVVLQNTGKLVGSRRASNQGSWLEA